MDSNSAVLCQAFAGLDTESDVFSFLQDLLTPGEIQEFSQRLDIASRLSQGETYKDIEKNTGASSTTIARVAKCISGEAGGYRHVLAMINAG